MSLFIDINSHGYAEPHSHPFKHFVALAAGRVRARIGNADDIRAAPYLFEIPAGVVHSFEPFGAEPCGLVFIQETA